MLLGKTASLPSTDAMDVAVIPDAKEPDGPHDETVGLENDLAEAVEVKLDGDGMVVLENNLGGAIEVCRKAIIMLSHMVYQYALRKRT